MTATIIAPFHGEHDHDQCLDDALLKAENSCRAQGLRLTSIRRQVLMLVWKSHKPQSAYDILEGLKSYGHKPAPPTAYSALDFLEQAKLIHRIESLNAYVGCAVPEKQHTGQFFICENCASASVGVPPACCQMYAATCRTSSFMGSSLTASNGFGIRVLGRNSWGSAIQRGNQRE